MLRKILFQKVLNRHSLLYEHFIIKSHTRQQMHSSESEQLDEFRYNILARTFEIIWRKILKHTKNHVNYQNSTLVLTDWNQKIHFQDLFFAISRIAFLNHFEHRFDTFLNLMSETYVDLIVENIFIEFEAKNLTLLWKKFCLNAWAFHFRHSHQELHYIIIIQYSFTFIRDINSCNVKLHLINHLRRVNEIVFNKVYHLRHHLLINFWHITFFQNFFLKVLPLSALKWERWYTVNLVENARFNDDFDSSVDVVSFYQRKYRQHIQTYFFIKFVVVNVNYALILIRFIEDFRKKYRMILNVVRAMSIDNAFFDVDLWHSQHRFMNENISSKDADDSTDDESINFNFDNYFFSNFVDFDIFHSTANRARSNEMKIHRPYWILLISKVNRFVLVMLNCYFFFFEILIARLHSSSIILISTSFEKQKQNVVINNVFLRFVQFVSDDQSNFVMRELWLQIYIDFWSILSSTVVVFQASRRSLF